MSYLEFRSPAQPETTAFKAKQQTQEAAPKSQIKRAFSDFVVKNYGNHYLKKVKQQRELAAQGPELDLDESQPLVGIVGSGFAGMYAGLILQSLGLEFELFEASDRVGGRIDTWYSKLYNPTDPDQACLYGEVGGMRVRELSTKKTPFGLCLKGVFICPGFCVFGTF